ncbi:MAG: acetyl-CoA hydrolase/transferase family protein [Chloroflexi bacterium]|nr:acetyl-CoA hydrolase/transferase family protein [Chloroflexota bacterium]
MEIVSAEQAVAHVRSGDLVHIHGTCATPSVLLDALVARAPELRDVRITHLHTEGPAPHLDPAVADSFRHLALFIGANARQAVAEGRADYIPTFLSDVPRLFASRALPVDTVFLNTTRPDAHGFVSLGSSVDVMPAAIRAATHVVAQLNASMPRTLGASFIHVDDIELGVEVDVPPWSVHPAPVGDVQRRIGAHVADLVPDGATLQLGIGAIPSAVTEALHRHRDLGIHTEVFTDAVVDLVERGVVTGSRKELDRGAIVTAFLMGTPRLWSFVDDNPMVQMRPVDYTNDTAIIRRFRRMTSINSAIEIDLTGQVVADSIGGRFYSGIGGQMDFVRGASLAPQGRAIICLPSTAARDTVSRIVARLTPGGGVVTTRGHVHTVVTEHGVAELHGRTIRERAAALIAIAHPAFRETLERQAHELGLLGRRTS